MASKRKQTRGDTASVRSQKAARLDGDIPCEKTTVNVDRKVCAFEYRREMMVSQTKEPSPKRDRTRKDEAPNQVPKEVVQLVRREENTRAAQIDVVKDMLLSPTYVLPNMPQHSREMLAAAAHGALILDPSQRHVFEARMVEMINKVVVGVRNGLQDKVQAAQTHLDEITMGKAEIGELLTAGKEQQQAKHEEIGKFSTNKKSNKTILVEAESMSEAVVAADRETKERRETITKDIEKSGRIHGEYFVPLRDGAVKSGDVTRMLSVLVPQLELMQADNSLMLTVSTMLAKPADERSAFENMAVTHLDETFTTFATTRGGELGRTEGEIRATEEAVAKARDDVKEKTEKFEASAKELAKAEDCMKECEGSLRELEKRSIAQDDLMVVAADNLQKAKAELKIFGTVEDAFQELQTTRMIAGAPIVADPKLEVDP